MYEGIDICATAAICAMRYGTLAFAYFVESSVTYATFRDLAEKF